MNHISPFNHNGVKFTHHAQERAYERTSIKNREDLCEHVDAALNEGIDVMADPILRDLCYRYAVRQKNSGMYMHKGIVFVFKEESLVTVFPVNWLANYDERGYLAVA